MVSIGLPEETDDFFVKLLLHDYAAGCSGSSGEVKATISCLVPRCNGVSYCHLPSKETLWDNYYTEAPVPQRQFVAQYNIVKRV